MSDIMSFSPLWGEWEIKDLIGEGTFGAVYRAEKNEYGNTYVSAIKHISIPDKGFTVESLISEGYASDAGSAKQYFDTLRDHIISEINFCYTLRGNSNIVSYEDHCIIPKKDGVGYDIFIRMEYLTALTKYMKTGGISEDDVIRIGIDICSALMVIDAHHILHRDIKPANIFVNPMGVYKLGDFGESKVLSGASVGMTVRGTYAYMSPEISRGQKANITADIYSLGLVMYRLLNGNRSPFIPVDAPQINSQMQEQANIRRFGGERLPLPAYCTDHELCDVIMKACEYNPGDRWENPEDMKDELEAIRRRRKKAARAAASASVPTKQMQVQPSVQAQPPYQYADQQTVPVQSFSSPIQPHAMQQGYANNMPPLPVNPPVPASTVPQDIPPVQLKTKKKLSKPVTAIIFSSAAFLIAFIVIIIVAGSGGNSGSATVSATDVDSACKTYYADCLSGAIVPDGLEKSSTMAKKREYVNYVASIKEALEYAKIDTSKVDFSSLSVDENGTIFSTGKTADSSKTSVLRNEWKEAGSLGALYSS